MNSEKEISSSESKPVLQDEGHDLEALSRRREKLAQKVRKIDERIQKLRHIQPMILEAQKTEITEYHIYKRLSEITDNSAHRKVLSAISKEELNHYRILKDQTGRDVAPRRVRVRLYLWLSRIFGLRFTLRLMESREDLAQKTYQEILEVLPEAEGIQKIRQDEYGHEDQLIGTIDETRLRYASSVVLGLNDALVELTGAIAGYTLALQNNRIIAVISLLTGISASLSMAGSEYLSIRTEDKPVKRPLWASLYTGIAYIAATVILVAPFFILSHHLAALGWTLGNALLLIFLFTFYISFAKEYSFKRRFFEMVLISWGVAAVSFGIGYLARRYFDLDI